MTLGDLIRDRRLQADQMTIAAAGATNKHARKRLVNQWLRLVVECAERHREELSARLGSCVCVMSVGVSLCHGC